MVKLLTRVGRNSGRSMALATLTMTLAACGGDSGDTTSSDFNDIDGDGIPNSEDLDNDNDGINDINDTFVDLDGDGFDDPDNDFDGLRDSIDTDADGDGIEDLFDSFVDLDNDGLDDFSNEPEQISNVAPITDEQPCGAEPGTDNASEDPNWNNNCFVRIANNTGEGQFANSLYTVGIQRVVFCSGFGNGTSYTDFADGLFGNLTEGAVFDFQESSPDPQNGDGEVGPRTWEKLQNAIALLGEGGEFMDNGDGNGTFALDAYGFTTGRCANIPLFYQIVFPNSDPALGPIEDGWLLARNTPNDDETAPFSISGDLSVIE